MRKGHHVTNDHQHTKLDDSISRNAANDIMTSAYLALHGYKLVCDQWHAVCENTSGTNALRTGQGPKNESC